MPRKPTPPGLALGDVGTVSPRLARAVRLMSALPALPPTPRPRGRPRASVKREKLTVLLTEPVALRLRLHCDYTRSELSAFVERAVVAALGAGADNGTRKIT